MKPEFAAVCAALAFVLAPVASAADKAADKAPSKMEKAAEKTNEVIDETAITAKIKAEYAKDKTVSAMKIHVETDKGGVVKLTGNARSKAESAKAVEIAKSVHGVTSVKNEITVGGKK